MKKVELIAIEETLNYYKKLGYKGYSVEKENKGWDLEFIKENTTLLVEVKGVSSSNISVYLSRNEYEKMQFNIVDFRLSIVSNCFVSPTINIFLYNKEKKEWIDQFDNILEIQEILTARCLL